MSLFSIESHHATFSTVRAARCVNLSSASRSFVLPHPLRSVHLHGSLRRRGVDLAGVQVAVVGREGLIIPFLVVSEAKPESRGNLEALALVSWVGVDSIL